MYYCLVISRPGLSPILSISVLSFKMVLFYTFSCFFTLFLSNSGFQISVFNHSQHVHFFFLLDSAVFSSGVTIVERNVIRQVYIVSPLKCVSYYGNLFVSSLTLIHLHPMQSRLFLRGPNSIKCVKSHQVTTSRFIISQRYKQEIMTWQSAVSTKKPLLIEQNAVITLIPFSILPLLMPLSSHHPPVPYLLHISLFYLPLP